MSFSSRIPLIAQRVEDKDYKVKLEIFEGPLDLLLYLIKKDEIGIYDVAIERGLVNHLICDSALRGALLERLPLR